MARRWRGAIIGGILLAVVAGFLAVWLNAEPTIDQAQIAYNRGDFARAEVLSSRILDRTPAHPDALRWQGRALARLGKNSEAQARFNQLGSEKLEADDLVLIGLELDRASRPILAWAAIQAALRLDAKHRASLEARTRISGNPAVSGPNASRVDRLIAVPDGPALAELVLSLERLTRTDQLLLDRLLARDRATFLGLHRPPASRKLVARLLLEDGRASDALATLVRTSDPESNWLASRAWLKLGDIPKARAALKLSASFGTDHPITAEPTLYVGARTCVECHSEIYQTQQKSRHASTFWHGESLGAIPLPKGVLTDPENSQVFHQFERKADQIQIRSKLDGKTMTALIDCALGSGHHGMTMLARDDSGKHRSLRISYYAGGDSWGLTSGFEPHPRTSEGYIGEPLSDTSFRNCLNCHTTRFTSEANRKGPEVADHGIGCERCHGPGDNHLRAMAADFPEPAIARPRLATPAQRLNLCGQCHGPDGVIPPSDPRFIRFQAANLPYSRCMTETQGRLDCVSCHDPHRNVVTDAAYYEIRCLACHGEARSKTPGLRFDAVMGKVCPVNSKRDCITCHMPKVDKIMPFTSFTDHHIRIHR